MNILRSGSIIHTVEIDEQTIYTAQLMGDHTIRAIWHSKVTMDIRIGDYVTHKGMNYTCNLIPEFDKQDNQTYIYTVRFEHPSFDLFNRRFRHLGAADFTYTASLTEFMELIVSNMNSISAGWSYSLGGLETPVKQMGFTLMNDGIHWNDRGSDLVSRLITPIFDF